MKYDDYKDRIDHLHEIRGVYDGWSVAVLNDGTMVNRWANDAGDGPEPGYERRYAATQEYMDGWQAGQHQRDTGGHGWA